MNLEYPNKNSESQVQQYKNRKYMVTKWNLFPECQAASKFKNKPLSLISLKDKNLKAMIISKDAGKNICPNLNPLQLKK